MEPRTQENLIIGFVKFVSLVVGILTSLLTFQFVCKQFFDEVPNGSSELVVIITSGLISLLVGFFVAVLVAVFLIMFVTIVFKIIKREELDEDEED
jgi:capsular polysaccharide biosynthesis protein